MPVLLMNLSDSEHNLRFGWTSWRAGSSEQDSVRPAEFPRRGSARLELASTQPRLTSISRRQFGDAFETHLYTQAYA